MATCNDCIHSGVCVMRREPRCFLTDPPISENIEHECLDFHAKDCFVEFPCRVGDSVFTIDKKGNIQECIVINVNCKTQMMLDEKPWIDFIIGTEPVDDSLPFPMIFTYSITKNRILFLTRESAEQALKKDENND